MAILPILQFPDERLRTKAKEVKEFTPELQTFIDDMIETMYAEEGIGLAASQVDNHIRLVVIDVSEKQDKPMVFINPIITAKKGETGIEEGCLSVYDYRALVPRAEFVTVSALDREGKPFEIQADGLLAICLQHELDHLDGKLFVDYLSPLKRDRLKQKLAKIARLESRLEEKGS
ncbi:peptide deformylase [Thorsellia kenyensis]|uniref:Peptide deformylase n=1 Tax=Thorsellia kenyensis TaxID=1549888 RepID=A0ABV6CCH6_9GAMM